LKKLKNHANNLKRETYTLYLVYKDSDITWWKRIFLGIVIGYAFCPIDLIPEFIPIFGYLDDLILVPLGISLALKLIPKEVIEKCRRKAIEEEKKEVPIGKKTTLVIILIWIIGLGFCLIWFIDLLRILLA
jgi:uncharacterized membrane protein YkvA (DUF1232 family)